MLFLIFLIKILVISVFQCIGHGYNILLWDYKATGVRVGGVFALDHLCSDYTRIVIADLQVPPSSKS